MKLKNFKSETNSKKKKSGFSNNSKAHSQNLVPRILVPDPAVYLPIYGPSLHNVFKIQLLPPVGPIRSSEMDDLGEVSMPLRSTS